MCGIAGIISAGPIPSDRPGVLARMLRVMAHRGPDDEGYYSDNRALLGHRRLSIIDLSTRAHQPMTDESRSLWLVENGEIYNYLELRKDLAARGHRFHSDGDTETILHAWQEEGPRCLKKLNGMFAFALWNTEERELTLARDPFGIKPVYYFTTPGEFVFASEAKALAEHPGLEVQPDLQAMADYLTFQYVIGEKTLFRGVRKLPPGCWARVKDGRVSVSRYWQPPLGEYREETEEVFAAELAEELKRSVRLQLRSDVPVGCHLSGGLDTGLISSIAARELPGKLHSFSGAFSEGGQYDESRLAALTSSQAGTEHHIVRPSPADLSNTMEKLVWHLDEPVAAPGSFPQYFVSKLASSKVKVVLGGQGADEMIGGYTRYYLLLLNECMARQARGEDPGSLRFQDLVPALPQARAYRALARRLFQEDPGTPPELKYLRLIGRCPDLKRVLSPDGFASLEGYSPEETYLDAFPASAGAELLDRVLFYETTVWLPALLQVEDRTSMAWSLESRVPFLDTRIAELVFSMKPAIKFKGGRMKSILRRVARGMVPGPIVDRMDKVGFPVPLKTWFSGELGGWLRENLAGGALARSGLIADGVISNALQSGDEFDRLSWGLLSLEMWHRLFPGGARKRYGSVAGRKPGGTGTACS